MQVDFFEQITIKPPRNRIYSRLGYSRGKTRLEKKDRDRIEADIEKAVSLIKLKGAGLRIPIQNIKAPKITLSGGIVFESVSLAELLTGSEEALLIGATAGNKIVRTIERDAIGKNVTSAVVFDAVASEMTDASLDWIIKYFNSKLSRENKFILKKRFSAGYGDFNLENQKIICKTLKIKKLGVRLTPNYMLVPEKSVTAVTGIKLASSKRKARLNI